MKGKSVVGILMVGAAALVCVPFAPTNLGGHTTYVTTHGTSMAPRFHAGDLAVVQPQSAYHVGDIVAYHSPTLGGATVLHRIIAIQDGHFTFKGDNNDFVDPDHPTANLLVGRLRFHIPHGGAVRSWLARPFVLFPLLTLAIGGAGAGLFETKRRRRRGRASRPASPRSGPNRPRRRLGVAIPIAAALIAIGCLLSAFAVWNMPRSETVTRRTSYRQNLTVGYSGAARAGAAYPNGKINTGDPLFTRLVKRVHINVAYELQGVPNSRHFGGTYSVTADLSGAVGWHRSLAVTPTRSFSGDHLRATAIIDLATLRRLEARFSAETGLDVNQASVTITPRVHATGAVAGTPFVSDISAKLGFQLTQVAMIPSRIGTGAVVQPAQPSQSAAQPAKATQAGTIPVTEVRPRTLTIWRLHLSGEWARVALLVALALVLAVAATVLTIGRRRTALGEVDAIIRRYGKLLIATRSTPPTEGRAVVPVDSMHSLARLAQLHEELIVHADAPGAHRFVLFTETGAYSYDAARTGLPARAGSLTPA